MANIILKDKNGANVVYKNVDYVSFQTLEGGTVRFNERAAKIISVTELPTEGIDDNAIYRLTTVADDGKTTVEFYAHENSGEWITVAEGAKMSELVVTENGEYTPIGAGAEDGFSKVTVNIDTFTDVDELPVENIDGDAIYRVTTKDADTGSVVIVNDELVTTEAGAFLGRVFNYTVVDELPAISALEAPTTDDAGVITANAYIIRSTGVPHYTVADESGNLFLAEMGLLSEHEFKGALPAEVTESGMYSVINVGTTYTTYGLLDANNTKTVLEFTADEGWVECGNGGNVTPLEITKNGVTYDENTLMYCVGDLKPDNVYGNYVYKHKINKAVLVELYERFGNINNGVLFEFSVNGTPVHTQIRKVNSDYALAVNTVIADDYGIGYFYCTNGIYMDGIAFPAGWNFFSTEMADSFDSPVMSLGTDEDINVPMILHEDTLVASEELLDFYRDNLIAKKVDVDSASSLTKTSNTAAGKIGDTNLYPSDFNLTVGQIKEHPIALESYATTDANTFEGGIQMPAMLSAGFLRAFFKALGNAQGIPEEEINAMLAQITPEALKRETGAYFIWESLSSKAIYVKDLTADGAADLVGNFEEGKWYVSTNFATLAPYCKATFDAFNPVTVNIPNADTIVEVGVLPTSGVESDKIYKKVDRTAKYGIMAKLGGEFMNIIPLLELELGGKLEVIGVETLPDTFIPSTETEMYIYLVLPTGEMLKSTDGTTAEPTGLLGFTTDQFGGVTEDPAYVPEDDNVKYFFLKSYDEFVTYGLPNNGTDKKYYEYNEKTSTWDELDSGDMLMARVDDLPVENVNDSKVYCVKNEIEAMIEMYIKQDGLAMTMSEYLELMESMISATTAIKYYVVDELPASPTVSIMDQEALNIDLHIYILASTGEPYVSTDGTTCVFFGESGMLFTGEYKGQITDGSEATEEGYYTIMRDYSVNYTYGIPMSDNKTVYTHNGTEWILAKNDVEEVTELPTENVVEQTVYKIPGTEESGATIGIVDTDNAKTIMVYRNGTWVRFVEETPAVEPETPTDPEVTDPTTEPTDPTTDPEATT